MKETIVMGLALSSLIILALMVIWIGVSDMLTEKKERS